MDVKTLNALVSSAIWRAEQLEELTELRDAAALAWQEVSKLEEELAKIKPAADAEGRIARRGAVRAAIKANDFSRAKELVLRFSQDGSPRTLRKQLRDLLNAVGKVPPAKQSEAPHGQKMIAFISQTFGSSAGLFPISKATPSTSEKVNMKDTQDKLDNLVNSQVTVHYAGPHVTIYNLHVSVPPGEDSKPRPRKSNRLNMREFISRN